MTEGWLVVAEGWMEKGTGVCVCVGGVSLLMGP